MPKYDSGKPQFSLIDPKFMLEFAQVMTMGAEKYGADNWKTIENAIPRYTDALHRHLNAFEQGKMDDEESGLAHLAHVAANAMFLYWLALNPQKETITSSSISNHPLEICRCCAYDAFSIGGITNIKCLTCNVFYGCSSGKRNNFLSKKDGHNIFERPECFVIKGCPTCTYENECYDGEHCLECDASKSNWVHKIRYSGHRAIDILTLEITPGGQSDVKAVRAESYPIVGDASSNGYGRACRAANHEEKSRARKESEQALVIFDIRRASQSD